MHMVASAVRCPRRWGFLSLAILLCACNPFSEEEIKKLMPKDETVLLTKENHRIGSVPLVIALADPVTILDDDFSVCTVLKREPKLKDKPMDGAFADALRGAKVRIDVVTHEGKKFALSELWPAWQTWGVVSDKEELLGCAYAKRVRGLHPGTLVKEVGISSDADVEIFGAYVVKKRGTIK